MRCILKHGMYKCTQANLRSRPLSVINYRSQIAARYCDCAMICVIQGRQIVAVIKKKTGGLKEKKQVDIFTLYSQKHSGRRLRVRVPVIVYSQYYV